MKKILINSTSDHDSTAVEHKTLIFKVNEPQNMDIDINMHLLAAVARGDLPSTIRLLSEGADASARDYNDSTPLHIAAVKNLLCVANHLIKSGANVDSRDVFGRTPLDIAMQRKNKSIAAALTGAGAQSQLPRRCSSCLETSSERRRFKARDALVGHFPASVAEYMMQGKAVPRLLKQDVSIFFANVVDYSSLRGTMDPAGLFDLLERLFIKLDRLADDHGVQRVDVIDGCYIAAANFSTEQAGDHAVRLAHFALDAVAAAGATALDEQRPELGAVRLLAGMHCGEACGSVVGAHGGRKYTLHGDAVNVASRMESHGLAGSVQCSAASAARIEEQGGCGEGGLRLAPRDGGVEVKGRGHMAAFWLGRGGCERRASSCPAGPTSVYV